jgi:transposase
MKRSGIKALQQHRLQEQLTSTSDVRLYRRTLAVLEYARGRSVQDIANTLGVSRQSVHNWIALYLHTFDARSLADGNRAGRPRLWTPDMQELLRDLMEHSPDRWGHLERNWTVPLLQTEVERATGSRLSEDTIRRGLRAERYVWKRPRYMLEPDPDREKKECDSGARAATGPRDSIGRGG